MRFGHVTVALSARTGVRRDGTGDHSDGTAVPGSMRDVAFGGRPEAVVAAGAEVLGEVTGAPGTIVAFGDSITNGAASTPGRNQRWPDLLAARLATSPVVGFGVANAGVSGNRILLDARHPRYRSTAIAGRSGLSRFAADALEPAGVRTVIVFAGVNDIIQTPRQTDPARVVEGLTRLVHQGQARGVRVVVCTIPPFRGWSGHTTEAERVRGQVNAWIRTREAFADFDLALRDPADPLRLRPDLDGGDHLHPNDAGMFALAAAVPLEQLCFRFRPRTRPARR
ncbi:GDSL-type esterase/lipase family protein [Actinoplanes solisilvae]|uniref:GDSL-type esterase/lipase family protein n=1 Tax=Actinoplanes solisilvae TaxID=2486853 RepID=UPI00196B1BA9|nr:GDSL-type esterase/lipase family protein [Actinoplanes solisilvae]